MKILFIAHFQNDGTPTASFIHSQIMELKKMGNEILVISPVSLLKRGLAGNRTSPIVERITIDDINHIYIRFLSLSRWGMWEWNAKNAISAIKHNILDEIVNFSPEVIHAHTIGFDSEIGGFLKSLLHIPLVVTIHGSDARFPIDNGRIDYLKKWCNPIDEIITVSSKIQRELAHNGIDNIITTVHNGYNHSLTQVKDQSEKKKHSVLQVGSLIESKHNDITIRAFQQYKKKYPDAIYNIIGEGPKKNTILEMCRNNGIEDSVFIHGNMSNDRVLGFMEESEYFIMPSYPEGFGIVYLEAMSKGCITIGTIGEGIEDLIDNGSNGFLVEKGDYQKIYEDMVWCEENPQQSEKISENARNSVSDLGWDRNARQCMNIYKEVVEHDTNRRRKTEYNLK